MTTFCIALYDNRHSTVHAIYTRRHVTHGGKISVKNAVRRIGQDNILLCKNINVHFSRKGSLSMACSPTAFPLLSSPAIFGGSVKANLKSRLC